MIALVMTGVVIAVLLRHVIIPTGAAYLIGINLVTFLLYWYDKQVSSAGQERSRIPNWLLLGFALVGGSLGAMFGIHVLHHKAGRKYLWFRLIFWIIVLGQLGTIYCLFLDTGGYCQQLWDACLDQIAPA